MKKTWISTAHRGFVGDEHMQPNTLSAFVLAAKKGADMIETDARTTSDGVIIVNHDPVVQGLDKHGNLVEYEVSKTPASIVTSLILASDDKAGVQYVPTLASVLEICYFTGMMANIDLKEGSLHALDVARLVQNYGMRGRTVYATNGSGAACINGILAIDPEARFIDRPENYTDEKLKAVPGYQSKCYAYTEDFSDENILKIRASGCKLATITLNSGNVFEAFRHHPDMAEYPHTSDFEALDAAVLKRYNEA